MFAPLRVTIPVPFIVIPPPPVMAPVTVEFPAPLNVVAYPPLTSVVLNVNCAPEFEDCRQLAATHDVPLKQVMAEATLAYLKDAQ